MFFFYKILFFISSFSIYLLKIKFYNLLQFFYMIISLS
jgi:hypothetical protein